MKKHRFKYFIAGLFLFLNINISTSIAQELKCNVQVVSSQIQGTNRQVFQTLQNAIYEFMNTMVWTNHVYQPNERIECNILINLTEQISADEFRGSIQVQSNRPVYNSSYNTVLLNYRDNNFHIRYVEFEPLEYNPTSHISNLTSILAYYAYIIIGMDYDTFSYNGGDEYFSIAENIVTNAQNAPESGWKPFDAKSNRNRYWLVTNILDADYEPLREFYYRYHRQGLDVMSEKVNQGREEITASLDLLQDVFREKPDPFMHYLQVVMDAKGDEIIKVYSEANPEEKSRAVTILSEIDPANATKYQAINK